MSELSDEERLLLVDRVQELRLNEAQKSILSDKAMNCHRDDADFSKLTMLHRFWGRHREGLVSYANFSRQVDKACGLSQEQQQQQHQQQSQQQQPQQGNQQGSQVVGWQASSAGGSRNGVGAGGGGSGADGSPDSQGGRISAGEEEEEDDADTVKDLDCDDDDHDDGNAHGNGDNGAGNNSPDDEKGGGGGGWGGGGDQDEDEQDSGEESDADPETKQFVDLHTKFHGFLVRHLWRTDNADFECPGDGYWEDGNNIKLFRDSTSRDLKVAKQAVFPKRIPNNPLSQSATKQRFESFRRGYHLCKKVAVSHDGVVYRATDAEIEAALEEDEFIPDGMTDAAKYIRVVRETRRRHRIAREEQKARVAERATKRAATPAKRRRSR